jgi:hypothetical protein
MDIIDKFNRIYYFSKRMAMAVTPTAVRGSKGVRLDDSGDRVAASFVWKVLWQRRHILPVPFF